jgi:hypothetical protein
VFFYAASAIRALICNAMIVGGAFGFDKLLEPANIAHNVENAAINLFARTWVDQWINNHQAKTLRDGTIVVEKGQWSPARTIATVTVWNVVYGLVKNLDLLNYGSYAKWTYLVLGATGAVKILWDERFTLKRKASTLIGLARGIASARCETLLTTKARSRE